MSHFSYLYHEPTFTYYGFGKSVGATWDVAEMAILACRVDDLNELLQVFPARGWGVNLQGVENLLAWVKSCPSDPVLYCDSGGLPSDSLNRYQWWRCMGSLHRPERQDIFDAVGKLSAPPWKDVKEGYPHHDGLCKPEGLEKLQEFKRKHPTWGCPGLPL